MKRVAMRSLVERCLALIVALAGSVQAAVHVDDAGRSVEFTRPAQRVITLAPSLTEIVYAVGAGPLLVGTMDTSNHPEAAKLVTRIGDYQRLDVERILSLKPDLILVWHHGNQGRELEQLEAAGLRLFYLEPQRLDDVPKALLRIGALLGRSGQAEQLASTWRGELAALRERYARAAPVSVFFQVWSQPLMTLNDRHLISDVIALCGGRNVFGMLPSLVPQLSVESVVAAAPEVMLTTRESARPEPAWQRDPKHTAFDVWQRFSTLPSVKHRWMYTVPGDLLTRPGPRAMEGAKAVCAAFDQVRSERDKR